MVIGFERDARRMAFDHDAVDAEERDQVGYVPGLLQRRDLVTDAGVPAADGVHLGDDLAEYDVLA